MSEKIISTENLNEAKELWAVSPNNFNGLIDSHLLANERIAELEAQLAAEKKKARELDVLASEQDATIKALIERLDSDRSLHQFQLAERDRQLKAAREALEGYADRDNWAHRRESGCWDWWMGDGDGWEEACKALAALDGEVR